MTTRAFALCTKILMKLTPDMQQIQQYADRLVEEMDLRQWCQRVESLYFFFFSE
jgi:hypothetical protein